MDAAAHVPPVPLPSCRWRSITSWPHSNFPAGLCVFLILSASRVVNPGNPVIFVHRETSQDEAEHVCFSSLHVHFRHCLFLKHSQSAVVTTATACSHLILYLGSPPLRSLATYPMERCLEPQSLCERNYNYNNFPIFFSLFFLLSPLLSTVSQADPSGSWLIK